ncbi:MAG: FtsX-like permease family protein [Phycisphaerales bacterium]|jgi:putative ABC transport system permease protein
MIGPLTMAMRHAAHHVGRTVILVLCVCVTVFLPLATRVLSRQFETALRARANNTPLVAGAKGSRFDLVMAALYFRRAELSPVNMADWQTLQDTGLADAIPLNVRFTSRERPIVCAPIDYLTLRNLRVARGTAPKRIGDAVLGANVAAALKLGPGDAIFSDQRELYDIAKAPALKMRITGVLAPSHGPDDDCVFADIKTAWILEGVSHGHADAAAVPPSLVLDKTPSNVVVSEAMVDYNEVTDANVGTFHQHGDATTLPLSGVILVPHSAKDESIIKARFNAKEKLQVVAPREVVDELIGQVLKLRSLMDALAVVVGVITGVLIALVTALSAKVRAREIEALVKIGASRSTILAIFGFEMLLVITLGAALAIGAAALLAAAPPDLVKLL